MADCQSRGSSYSVSSEDQTGLVAEVFVEKGVFKKKKERKEANLLFDLIAVFALRSRDASSCCLQERNLEFKKKQQNKIK